MAFLKLVRVFSRVLRRNARPGRARPPRRCRPALALLEDRSLPSTYTVTNLGDTGQGSGLEGDLRYAITAANADPDPSNGIVFQPGLAGTITLTQGPLTSGIYSGGSVVAGPVTIRSSVIADNHADGGSFATGGGLYLDGPATIADSTIAGNTAGDSAGGIFLIGDITNPPVATVSDSAVVGNTARFYGGLENLDGTLTLTRTSVSGNTGFAAAGIYNGGRMTVTDSLIADNVGPGIKTLSQLTMSGSTISGNASADLGGGLFVGYGDAQVVNCTFSGNTAASGGGGIVVYGTDTLELTSVTITGNASGSGFLGGGGGLKVLTNTAQYVLVRNTLIAGNSTTGAGPDVSGGVISLGYNLVGQGEGSQGWRSNDVIGNSSSPIDPRLGPLQANGGPTPTHALLYPSPAIERGDPALGSSFDQRGTVRFHSGVNAPVDIGAFDEGAIHSLRLVAPAEVTAGEPFTVTVTALDGSGHTASTFLGTLHLSSSDPGAVLPGDYTLTPADGGTASFTVTLPTPGSQQLQVETGGPIHYRATATVSVDPSAAPPAGAGWADLFPGLLDPTGPGSPSAGRPRSGGVRFQV